MRQSPTILGVLFSLLLTNAGAHAQQQSFSCSKTDECMRVFSENGNNINLQLVRALLERLSLSVVSFEFVSDGCFIEGEAVTENQDITIVATSGSSPLGRRVGGQVRRSTALFISEPQVRCSIVDIPPPKCPKPGPHVIEDCQASPLVLDFGRRGFDLTGSRDGVTFDIDGDGTVDRTGWIAASAEDAFLARDLNGNGRIDDGRELFGDSTELRSGKRAENGFAALAELDATDQGGNGNGYVDPWDRGFGDLQLWNDRNHDGLTQPGELSALPDRGIVALELAYEASSRTDANGNRIALVSTGYVVQGFRLIRRTLADVFFVLEEPR